MASLSFERLLSRPDADKLPVKVLFKAALAFRRAGDAANAEKVWRKMADKAGRGDLVLRHRKVTLDQVRQRVREGRERARSSGAQPIGRCSAATPPGTPRASAARPTSKLVGNTA